MMMTIHFAISSFYINDYDCVLVFELYVKVRDWSLCFSVPPMSCSLTLVLTCPLSTQNRQMRPRRWVTF